MKSHQVFNLWNVYNTTQSVSAERVFQAIEAIKYAKSVGAVPIAHGSTGAEMTKFVLI
jgi:argininosuccinate synthase